ncbi:hypothetical protein HN51_052519 [Arachis hypogaea]|uniref:indole-3-pyruvate monooxygenase n=1 Tax=Arachis hypogaea TaxID=3818 RepID=A0A445CAE0_ARAHY|nr:probable indole-3-pyruvate monooxygenase YUCCA10 [Arachis ipaensis]XP_025669062.1 probable indole-3-pyruvate monooxygenase YUCCA10 [Arachis hypogaea]QHN93865.1 putative indole-3-pyruvate monooxygenase [Arachis hypogaea]RYR47900.1 hypothetical protein Ahy_A07g033885 [Arachis hypogaea]
MEIIEVPVVIVGAGPAGIATAGCLNRLNIANIVLERDDCNASFFRKRAHDNLKLHLDKKFCSLPHYPIPASLPNFITRVQFLRYIESYVAYFNVNIKYNRTVDSAILYERSDKWRVVAKDTSSGTYETYVSDFLVVATGEYSEGYIPEIEGLEKYEGVYIHSSKYLNGRDTYGKNVLVVGSGNSGMDIANDLSNCGAYTSIVVRSPVHFFSKETMYAGMSMLKHFEVKTVDKFMVLMSKLMYGNMSKYGLIRPKEGPFAMKIKNGTTPIIDMGCVKKIKDRQVKVVPAILNIEEAKTVQFTNGQRAQFDMIIFATGYRTNVLTWLKDYEILFNEDGMPKPSYPNHWGGEQGIYCAGFSKMGLEGISYDAKNIANHIQYSINLKVSFNHSYLSNES